MNNQPFWKSSADPTQLSLTVKGFLMAIIPLILLLARFKGITLSEGQIGELTDDVEKVLIALTSVWSAIQIIVGLIRKAYYAVHPKI